MDDLPELPTLAALENPAPPAPPPLVESAPPPAAIVKPVAPPAPVAEIAPPPSPVIVPKPVPPPAPAAMAAPLHHPVAAQPSAPAFSTKAVLRPVIVDPLAEALARSDHNPPTPRLDIQPWSSTSSTHNVMEAEASPAPEPRKTQRLLSLDAFRGVIMLLMASGGLGIPTLAKKFPDTIWASIAPYLEHVKWTGGVPWDMIQPSFMFMVGVAMPFSYANRMERGASGWELFFHALGRAMVLVLLGVLCASGAKDSTNWAFTNVLAQIGLGYVFLFLLWRSGTWGQVLGTLCILVGYWTWFAGTPALPPAASAYPEGVLTGDFAHWNMNANPAAAFDVWFLNLSLFPRTTPFVFSDGGYQTLNFIPSIATMCLGLMAGRFLRTDRTDGQKVSLLICAGGVLIALGLVAGEYACPIVKRIWTPSWVLYSGGIAATLLAVFYLVVEVLGARWLAWPFAVIGMNSILVYLLSQFSKGWIKDRLHQHLEPDLFTGAFAPMIESAMVLGVIWILCWWLYRQRAFLRI